MLLIENHDFYTCISKYLPNIEFLRKVVEGGASRSYGIQVAKMAGLPSAVIKRSQELMTRMQKDYSNNLSSGKKQKSELKVQTPQLSLFGK